MTPHAHLVSWVTTWRYQLFQLRLIFRLNLLLLNIFSHCKLQSLNLNRAFCFCKHRSVSEQDQTSHEPNQNVLLCLNAASCISSLVFPRVFCYYLAVLKPRLLFFEVLVLVGQSGDDEFTGALAFACGRCCRFKRCWRIKIIHQELNCMWSSSWLL